MPPAVPLDVIVVMDPIESIKIAKDSTFAMLLEAQRRGHRLQYVLPGGLSVAATRAVAIFPQTRAINVIGGEIIRFDVGTTSFAWHFDGPVDLTSFELQLVAPPGVLDHSVVAYIQPNTLYIGGGRRGRHGGGH